MANDIEIRVRVANQTSGGLTSVNTSLNTLKDRARAASQALANLTPRAVAAATALHRLAAAADDAAGELRGLTAAAGDTATALTTLRTATTRTANSMRTLAQRAEGARDELDELDTAALSASVTMDGLGDSTRSTNDDLGDLRGNLGEVRSASDQASGSLGGGAGLRGSLLGVAAALGTALLPSIGAFAPMLSGLAVVGGGAALAMDDLKKKAKELKPAFEEWKKAAEKAVAPHTERAVKHLKTAMKELQPQLVLGAETFGSITEKASKFAASPAFQSAFQKNAEMGVGFVERFAGSVGTFTQAFLDFGTKSKPALEAWEQLLGGLLDTGLPGMFKELEQGVGGSSQMLSGLASLLNGDLLPALGRIAGSFADAFGPLLGGLLETAGGAVSGFATIFAGAMEIVSPLTHTFSDILSGLNQIAEISVSVFGSVTDALGGALLDTIMELGGHNPFAPMTEGATTFASWVQRNQAAIRAAFTGIGMSIINMVEIGVQMLPILMEGFNQFASTALTAMEVMVMSLAGTFGALPGPVGKMFRDLGKNFGSMADDWRSKLDGMAEGAQTFADTALPNLERAKIVLRVDQAKANLASIKEQLEDPSLTAERKATLTADKARAEQAVRDANESLNAFDKKRATSSIEANNSPFFGSLAAANRARLSDKRATIRANTGPFFTSIGGIAGRVVGTSYINVAYRQVESNLQPRFSANGNLFRSFADGGMEDHSAQIAPAGAWRVWAEPETGGEAYIPLAPGKRKRSRQIAEETVGILGGNVEWFAKGGMSQTQKDLIKSFGISHFGWMAGYRKDPFEKKLGDPADLGSLVSSLNQLRGQIQKIFSGKAESNLLKHLDSVGKKLIGWEKQLTSVTKELDKAKSKLSDLKSAASQLSSSVRSGVLSSANITKGASGDGPVTVASIMGGLTASRDKSSAFAKALKDLQAKGLRSDLIKQIAEAGIEGGGLETAGALLGASQSEIGSINSLQHQIAASAISAGKTTADAVYAASIKSQEKYVKALTAQQARLEKSMEKLANALEHTIAKAMAGGKASGGIIGAASGGLRSGWTMVGEHEPELVRLPFGSRVYSGPDTRRMQQQAWASMLNEPRRAAQGRPVGAAAGGGDGQPIVIQLHLGEREFGEVWVDVGRKQVRDRGGIEATLRPPRGR